MSSIRYLLKPDVESVNCIYSIVVVYCLHTNGSEQNSVMQTSVERKRNWSSKDEHCLSVAVANIWLL